MQDSSPTRFRFVYKKYKTLILTQTVIQYQ